MKVSTRPRMIYTPASRIPVGEGVKRADGRYALRIKRAHGNEFDEIPIDTLIQSVVACAEAGPPEEPGAGRHTP